jgi:hypothetical protein
VSIRAENTEKNLRLPQREHPAVPYCVCPLATLKQRANTIHAAATKSVQTPSRAITKSLPKGSGNVHRRISVNRVFSASFPGEASEPNLALPAKKP